MDGLTISDSESLLKTGNTASQIRNEKINREAGATGDTKTFADTLKDAVENVNELSHESNVQMQKLATYAFREGKRIGLDGGRFCRTK